MEAHDVQTNEVHKKAFSRPKVLLGVLAALPVVFYLCESSRETPACGEEQ